MVKFLFESEKSGVWNTVLAKQQIASEITINYFSFQEKNCCKQLQYVP